MEKTAQAKLGKKKLTGDQWQQITIIGLILAVCIAFSFLSEAVSYTHLCQGAGTLYALRILHALPGGTEYPKPDQQIQQYGYL